MNTRRNFLKSLAASAAGLGFGGAAELCRTAFASERTKDFAINPAWTKTTHELYFSFDPATKEIVRVELPGKTIRFKPFRSVTYSQKDGNWIVIQSEHE